MSDLFSVRRASIEWRPVVMALVLCAVSASSALSASGCVLGSLSLDGRPCPCAEGWRCDRVRAVCVRATERPCSTRTDCGAGEMCIDGYCLRTDAGPPCFAELETCNGENDDCDTAVDEGATLCSLEHAVAACTRGACDIVSCQSGFDDCDGRPDNGCETELGTTADCARCDDMCSTASPFCAPGVGGARACAASCPAGTDECGGSCVDVAVDLHHCGACDAPCFPAHGVGQCAAGVCTVASCDALWDDCDDEVATGCEASLEGDATCGTCTRNCTTMMPGTCMVGRCSSGACVPSPGGPGAMCRPAVSVCDVAEACSADSACPADGFAVAGIACRSSTCGGLDPREFCTGTSGTCPPPCGCDGEPCCPGASPCSAGLDCTMSTCSSCTPTPLVLTGRFPMPAATSLLRRVTASGTAIAMTDGLTPSTMMGTITLPAGVTATGTFTPVCGTMCDWLTRISASGSTLTLTSGGLGGGMPLVSTITLVGATASGTVTATPISPTIPGYFTGVTTSGGAMTFVDSAMASGAITLTRTGGACP